MITTQLILVFLLISPFAVLSDDPNAVVQGLESVTKYNKKWYSGYANVTFTSQIHYWFFPSQNDPTKDPVLLWLNGGPGCSSLLGATQENGPFVFQPNTSTFELNQFSWNMKANVLYFESPPGVGFSQTDDLNYNDNTTANANLMGLISWFALYNEYQKNEFYIAGESYGGVYVPYLSHMIVQYNKNKQSDQFEINFKGFAVGNGCTHPLECQVMYPIEPFGMDFFYFQGLYPSWWRDQYLQACPNESQYNSTGCVAAFNKIMNLYNNLNQYDIYKVCYNPPAPSSEQPSNDKSRDYKAWRTIQQEKHKATRTHLSQQPNNTAIPPCVDGVGPESFFNNNNYRAAMHINPTFTQMWEMCSTTLNYTIQPNGSYYLYPSLIKAGLRIWVYSGDVDGSVPTPGTVYWVNQLKQQEKMSDVQPWRSWWIDGEQEGEKQNSGEVWKMTEMTLVTFKGVGHMVPQWNREGGFVMINAFLENKDLPRE